MPTRFLVRHALALAALACLAHSHAAHADVVLDFDFLPNPNGTTVFSTSQGHSVTQNGFTVTDTSNANGLFSATPNAGNGGGNYTGSVALRNGAIAGITTLTQNNGNPFTLNSIDIANLALQSNFSGGVTVTFTGNKQGGGTVTQSYKHGANDSLETVTFGNLFTNLLSVSLDQVSPYNQFDNIHVTAVPEASTLVALPVLLATLSAGLIRKRRSRS